MITDEEIIYDALRRYAEQRNDFVEKMAQPEYLKPDGEKPNPMEINDALVLAGQCNRLVKYAKEKLQSPIILVQ